MFNWFKKDIPQVRDVKDQIKESMLRLYYDAPHRVIFFAETLTDYLDIGDIPHHILVSKLVSELGIPINVHSVGYPEPRYEVIKESEVTYPNGTKVGDHYYVDGEYLGQCAYSLYKTFFDNPKRFKVVDTIALMLGRCYYSGYKGGMKDHNTGVIFHGHYSNFEMKSKVSEGEFDVLVKAITKYHEDRAERYEKLKQQRKERDILRLYCTCEDDK